METKPEHEVRQTLLPLLLGGFLLFLFFCPGLRRCFYFSGPSIQLTLLFSVPVAGFYFLIKTASALYRKEWSDAFAMLMLSFFSLLVLGTYIPELGK